MNVRTVVKKDQASKREFKGVCLDSLAAAMPFREMCCILSKYWKQGK